MKRHLGPLSVFWVILFMAITVFAANEVWVNGKKWGVYTLTTLDSTGKLNITGTEDVVVTANTISGTISNSTDFLSPIGIPNVTVTLSGDASKTATTGSDGKYSFTGLLDGSYTVTPTKTNFTFSPTSTPVPDLSGNQTATANFTASAGNYFTISGTVYTTSGAALSGATINLKLGSTSLDSATSGTDGTYILKDLLDGLKYTVVASKTSTEFTDCDLEVTINNGNATGINFTQASTTGGTWTAAIRNAHLCNQAIKNNDGSATSYGKGFYQGLVPDAPTVDEGRKAYFLIDSAWMSSFGTHKMTVIMFNQKVSGANINIYSVNSSDNTVKVVYSNILTSNGLSQTLAKTTGIRYLVEVDATNASESFPFTIYWQ